MLGTEDAELPVELKVEYKGHLLTHLSKTVIVVWNAGRVTLSGNDIVASDPLRFVTRNDSQLLDAQVVCVTREVIAFGTTFSPADPQKSDLVFDFLDPGDGAIAEFLHTGGPADLDITGTIRSLPKGCIAWGSIPEPSEPLPYPFSEMKYQVLRYGYKALLFLMLMAGIGLLISGITSDNVIANSVNENQPTLITRVTEVVLGLVTSTLSTILLWTSQRRFPKKLATFIYT